MKYFFCCKLKLVTSLLPVGSGKQPHKEPCQTLPESVFIPGFDAASCFGKRLLQTTVSISTYNTPPKTNMSPKKVPFQKERLVFQPPIFQGTNVSMLVFGGEYISFKKRRKIYCKKHETTNHLWTLDLSASVHPRGHQLRDEVGRPRRTIQPASGSYPNLR